MLELIIPEEEGDLFSLLDPRSSILVEATTEPMRTCLIGNTIPSTRIWI